VTNRPAQLALRDLRAEFSRPTTLFALAGVGLVLGVSGPFDTLNLLGLLPRIAYWIVVVIATYATGSAVHCYLRHKLGLHRASFAKRIALNGGATALGVMVVLTGFNTLVFGPVISSLGDALATFAVVLLISVVIAALLDLAWQPSMSDATTPPPLLKRLSFEKRGALVALSVEDHYVQVTTTQGTQMLLMRLSDAIRETAPTAGLQVHRSHWVARDQIASVKRTGDRAIMTLKTGAEIPASRTYIPALRDAGLLPTVRNG